MAASSQCVVLLYIMWTWFISFVINMKKKIKWVQNMELKVAEESNWFANLRVPCVQNVDNFISWENLFFKNSIHPFSVNCYLVLFREVGYIKYTACNYYKGHHVRPLQTDKNIPPVDFVAFPVASFLLTLWSSGLLRQIVAGVFRYLQPVTSS